MQCKKVILALVLAGWGVALQAATPVADPVARPALMVKQPSRAYLTGIAQAGKRLVAVGERGIVILSDDGGATWRQARVPASVTLAAVQFPTPSKGWAVGHYGIILHSADGGETWTRQLDGEQAARLALRDAQALAGADAAAGAAWLAEAERLVADGPDKPFLGLHFSDENNGFVVGAYNLAFRTRDGGKTWLAWSNRLDNPGARHMYAVRAVGTQVYIAGEQGLLLRSADGGERFAQLALPYKGSLFALEATGNQVVVAGLGGNAFRSGDGGTSWDRLALPAPVSVTAMHARGGKLLMTNQAGMLLSGDAGAASLARMKTPAMPPLNDVLVQEDGSIVAVGMLGAIRLPAQAGATPVSMGAQ